MKKYAMLAMVGLMCMAPTVYAQDSHMGHETTVETTKKEVHKKRMAKGKRTKPLTEKEKKELDNMQQTSTPPTGTNPEKSEVK